MLMFGMSSCQSFNCGCPMAEVKERERGSERVTGRLGDFGRERMGERVTGRKGDFVKERLDEGVRGEFDIAD